MVVPTSANLIAPSMEMIKSMWRDGGPIADVGHSVLPTIVDLVDSIVVEVRPANFVVDDVVVADVDIADVDVWATVGRQSITGIGTLIQAGTCSCPRTIGERRAVAVAWAISDSRSVAIAGPITRTGSVWSFRAIRQVWTFVAAGTQRTINPKEVADISSGWTPPRKFSKVGHTGASASAGTISAGQIRPTGVWTINVWSIGAWSVGAGAIRSGAIRTRTVQLGTVAGQGAGAIGAIGLVAARTCDSGLVRARAREIRTRRAWPRRA